MIHAIILNVKVGAIMFWNDKFDKKYPVVIGPNHPLSPGYRLKLVSTSPYVTKECRVLKKRMDAILESGNFEGMHGVWDGRRLVVLAINFDSKKPWSRDV